MLVNHGEYKKSLLSLIIANVTIWCYKNHKRGEHHN